MAMVAWLGRSRGVSLLGKRVVNSFENLTKIRSLNRNSVAEANCPSGSLRDLMGAFSVKRFLSVRAGEVSESQQYDEPSDKVIFFFLLL